MAYCLNAFLHRLLNSMVDCFYFYCTLLGIMAYCCGAHQRLFTSMYNDGYYKLMQSMFFHHCVYHKVIRPMLYCYGTCYVKYTNSLLLAVYTSGLLL